MLWWGVGVAIVLWLFLSVMLGLLVGRMIANQHQHTWTMVAHLDGCHAASWAYTCLCGATRHAGFERDFQDPHDMSYAHWFEESCERCNELAEGATPEEWDEVTERER